MNLIELFNSESLEGCKTKRDNFLARIVGLFGEDVSFFWFDNPKNKLYKNCGRPKLFFPDRNMGFTLDFLVQKKDENSFFLIEQKNFFAYNGGKLKTMDDSLQFEKAIDKWCFSKKNSTPAWKEFINLNISTDNYEVKVKGELITNKIEGKILIWSDVLDSGKLKYLERFNKNGFTDILGLRNMVEELTEWNDTNFKNCCNSREKWLKELFNSLR